MHLPIAIITEVSEAYSENKGYWYNGDRNVFVNVSSTLQSLGINKDRSVSDEHFVYQCKEIVWKLYHFLYQNYNKVSV